MFIHEFGAPEANIPARPVVYPAIANARADIIEGLRNAGVAALSGKADTVEKQFEAIGIVAQNAMRKQITTDDSVP